MTLKGRHNFTLLVALHLDHADVRIGATDSYVACIAIESHALSNCIASVNLHDLLDHADVPGLEEAVGVARGDVVAADREDRVFDRVQVPVERLHSQPRPHVPDRERAVRRTRHKEVREWLEIQRVHRVRMRSILLTHL